MKLEVEPQIIIDLPYGITDKTAYEIIDLIKNALNNSQYCDLYNDIELDF